jgi:hypothetical protein
MDTLYIRMDSTCIIIFFLIPKNLVVTGYTNMPIIGNGYTSDGQEDDARHS